MRIVVADADERLIGLLRTVLVPQGHEVLPASDRPGCETALRQHRPDVVLVEAELPGGGAAEALASWRSRDEGREAHVVLLSARNRSHPAMVALLRQLRTDHFLRKPFSMLDLGDTLAGLAPAVPPPAPAPAPTLPPARPPVAKSGLDHLTRLLGRGGGARPAAEGAAPLPVNGRAESTPAQSRRPDPIRANRSLVPRSGSAVSRDNAARLGRIWAGMETGRLHITGAASPVGAPVLFRDGGLVDARHLDLVDLALREGRLRFERTDVDGVGDHRALGSYLVESCRDPSAAGFAAQHTFDAPLLKPMRRPLSELPVSRDTRAVLGKADGRQTLGRLLAMLGVPAASVDADLACLRRLGLLTLSAPRARRTGASRPGASAAVTPQGAAGAGLSRTTGPATFGAEVHSDTTTRHVGAGPEPDSTPTSVTRSSVSSSRRRRRRERSTTRTEPVSTRRRRMPRMQPAVLEKQLERELSRLEGASPAMVLGVPPDSGTSLVKGVAARQRQRYQRIADDVRGQERVRELAARLLELVAQAEEKWGHSDRARTGATESQRELVWLEQGRALVDAGDFPRADRVLSRARDLTIANPDILAWLGVARLGNPERSEEERQSEGIDLLLLAEQFNPEHLTAVSWLARTYARSGQHDRALPRARRWARLDPEDSEASALLAELQRQKGEAKG